MNTSADWSAIPVGLQIALIAFAAVQVGLQVYALVKLFRTPDERLQFGKKWPWVLIIVFVNLVGAIVFLAAGRKPAEATDPLAAERASRAAGQVGPVAGASVTPGAPADDAPAPAADRAARAADVLYGSSDGDAS